MKMFIGDGIKLISSIMLCLSAGFIGSFATQSAIPTWYNSLTKPSFTPANWVFAPVWTFLYIIMGISAFLVWRQGWQHRLVGIALGFFLMQLILNVFWSFAFFGMRSPLFGLIVIFILWIIIVVTMAIFFWVSRIAGILLIPYLLWVTFASILNFSLYQLNRGT